MSRVFEVVDEVVDNHWSRVQLDSNETINDFIDELTVLFFDDGNWIFEGVALTFDIDGLNFNIGRAFDSVVSIRGLRGFTLVLKFKYAATGRTQYRVVDRVLGSEYMGVDGLNIYSVYSEFDSVISKMKFFKVLNVSKNVQSGVFNRVNNSESSDLTGFNPYLFEFFDCNLDSIEFKSLIFNLSLLFGL